MFGAAPSVVGGQLGRYELHGAIARGGMATVYIGRMTGAAGFARPVAIKRLHPHLAADSTFAAMFADEARLAARIRHPNVIDTLDVVSEGGELFIVMEFVNGETLAKLVRAAAAKNVRLPPAIVSSIIIGALEGLHAAHEATDERGEPLGIVHRDISPQNILVGCDGVPRVLDFGVAKAAGRMQETEGSEIKGKLAYMAPEQLSRGKIDRRCDVFAMGIVLWEALTSQRLFAGDDAASTLHAILTSPIAPPSSVAPVPPEVDAVVLRALEREPERRFATAQEMALALEAAILPAPSRHTGRWVEELAGEAVRKRIEIVKSIESTPSGRALVPEVDDATHPSGSGARRVASSSSSGSASGPSSSMTDSWRYALPTDVASQVRVPSQVVPSPVAPSWMPEWMARQVPPNARPGQIVAGIAIGGVFLFLLVVGLVLVVVSLQARSKQLAGQESADETPVASASAEPASAPSVASSVAKSASSSELERDPKAERDPQSEREPEPEQVFELEPEPTPSSASTTVASGPATTAPRATATGPRLQPPPVPTAPEKTASPPGDCENPFTVGPDGVKRPKPHCFTR